MADIKRKDKKFIYKNSIKWQGTRKGLLSSSGKPDIEVATPPEFRGHGGIWTPEDLFVASVNSCTMTTFLHYAERESLEFLSYESEAEGVLERIEKQFAFSEIKIRPRISVRSDADVQKVKDVIDLSKERCLISNSIKSKVEITPEIKVYEERV